VQVRLLVFDREAFERVLGPLRDLLDKKANMRMLAGVPIIAKLPMRERNAAFEMFTTETFKKGDKICREGEAASKFYLLRAGTVSVTRKLSPVVNEPNGPPPLPQSFGSTDSEHGSERQIAVCELKVSHRL